MKQIIEALKNVGPNWSGGRAVGGSLLKDPSKWDESWFCGIDFGKTCSTVEVTFENGNVIEIKDK